jgi:hypothetical protein
MTMLAASAAAHGASPVTVALMILTRAGRRYRGGGLCRRCRGTGRVRRIGATAVHRFWWPAVGDRMRERRRAAHQARQHADSFPRPVKPTERKEPLS